MTTVETSGFSDNEGYLRVVVPGAEPNRPYKVVVGIEPLEAPHQSTGAEVRSGEEEEVVPRIENGILITAPGWPKGYFNLVGCMADDPIERGPQGEYETREPLD